MIDTNPENFRRDAGVPCPVCKIGQHSFESMQLHYKAHTEAEKREAWEKTLQERRHVFALVPVIQVRRSNGGEGLHFKAEEWDMERLPKPNYIPASVPVGDGR